MIDQLIATFEDLSRTECAGEFDSQPFHSIVRDLISSDFPLFLHPLGFVQFEAGKLFSLPQPYDRARIHIFDQHYGSLASSPSVAHSHNWSLKSVVVFGEIENVIYDLNDDKNGSHCLFQVDYHSPRDARLTDKYRRGNLVEVSRTRYSSGQVYCQSPEVIHSSNVCSKMAVTFLLAKTTVTPALVVFKQGEIIEPTNSRREITCTERLDLLEKFDAVFSHML